MTPVSEAAQDAEPRVAMSFYLEQVAGEGEDAEPLVLVGYERSLLGVFDGLGGAGGTVYDTPGGRHTGAWFASRLARDVVAGHMPEVVGAGPKIDGERTARLLAERLRKALVERLAEFDVPRSSLRSKLLKALPSTMAVAYLVRDGAGGYACHCFWAGDSRLYVIDPLAGAQQLTTDDLRSDNDAMANLLDDSVMDNCLSADTEFVVHHRRVDLHPPFIALAASDGCFGYVASPMHFEHLVLSGLDGASSPDGWREALRAAVQAVAGDDATLALLAVGGDLAELKGAYRARLDTLRTTYIEPMEEVERQLRSAQQQASELEQRRATLRAELWSRYKPDYERHLAEAAPAPEPPAAEPPAAEAPAAEPQAAAAEAAPDEEPKTP